MESAMIIKGLECCTRGRGSNGDIPCLECPYEECNIVGGTSERQTSGTCEGWLEKDALALIKELTEEVEAYRQELGKVRVALNNANVDNKRLTEECENYKSIAEYQQNCNMDRGFKIKRLTEENDRLSTALAEYEYKTNIRIAEDYYTTEAYDELREENDRLKQLNESYAELEQGCLVTGVKKVQANSVREFAERFKELMGVENASCGFCNAVGYWSVQTVKNCIDRVANEILNENTEDEKK